MFDVYKIRKDFPMLDDKNGTRKVPIYLDNAATTFKPYSVIEATSKYYLEDSANAHRGDYDLAFKVDTEVDRCRANVAKFLRENYQKIILNLIAESITKMLWRDENKYEILFEIRQQILQGLNMENK